MISLIHEKALALGWLTEEELLNMIAVSESTPGPIAVNMATFVGSAEGGVLGSLAATAGVVLPSFLIILLIAAVLKNLTNNPYFAGFMKGVKPVVTGLILTTGLLLLLRSAVVGEAFQIRWFALLVFGIVAVACWASQKFRKKKLTAVPIILLSAGIGIVATILRQT
jgi:chromate transporter